MKRIPLLIALLSLALAASGGALAASGDPRKAAFEALSAASAVPLTGSTESGALRVIGFDVAAAGATPAIQARNFLEIYGAALGLTGPNQALVLRSARTDGPMTVVSFAEAWKGVPVFGGQVRVGIDNSRSTAGPRIRFVGGGLIPDLVLEGGLDVEATVSPAACVAVAQARLGRVGAPPLAEPRLMIYDPRVMARTAGARLVWAVTLAGASPSDSAVPTQVLCDAHAGDVVYERAFAEEALDLWEGLQFPNPSHTYLGDESGLNAQGQAHQEAMLEWGYAHDVYSFFATKFSWRGTQGDDNQLQLLVDSANGTCGRFFWDPFGEAMQIDTGCASFDVTAHEFTHGIIHHSSDLSYNGISGALNEGYADAMGVFVDDADWLLGEDRTGSPGYYIRNFKDPSDTGQPDTLGELCTSDDDCDYSSDKNGVHTNSGILNKAHYLIAMGDPFNGRPAFSSLGRSKMGALAFKTMKLLPSGATFQDARAYSLLEADFLAQAGLFGFTPANLCAVKNGFSAVEIGPGDFNCDGIDDNVQDPDGDFIPSSDDNCPGMFNPSQSDWDSDGVGNACDNDWDNDGTPDAIDNCMKIPNWDQMDTDGDGGGDACDFDNDGDDVWNVSDNCPLDYNPDQADGNGDGFGDACDADVDGDGLYAQEDNCTFVYNPAQIDTDGDLLGDACDGCPAVDDWNGSYIVKKWGPGNPVPWQPDSDGDGTPDACDSWAFGDVSVEVGGALYNPKRTVRPGDSTAAGRIAGPAGRSVRIPLPLCDPDGDPDPSLMTELVLTDLAPAADARLVDDDGLGLGAARPGPTGSNTRGIRLRPDCARTTFLDIVLGPDFPGVDTFQIQLELVPAVSPNPWVTPGQNLDPPPPIPDTDRDGLPDSIDSCPNVGDPTGANADSDAFGDVCDCAPFDASVAELPANVTGMSFDPDGVTLRWIPQAGVSIAYDVLRGSTAGVPVGLGEESCAAPATSSSSLVDPAAPSPGGFFWYLVRARNMCGPGAWGQDSAGETRVSAACP